MQFHRKALLCAAVMAALGQGKARAGDSLWLGGGPTSNWNDLLNWSPLGVPTSADTAYFTSNVAARGIAEFNGGATSVGALVFSGQSSLGIGHYGLKGNVLSQLNIGSILLVTPVLNPAGGTNTGVTIDNMLVVSDSTEIDSTCSLGLTGGDLQTGQLSLNGGTLGLTGAIVFAASVSMGGDSTVNINGVSGGLQCDGTFGISGAGVVNVGSTLLTNTLQMTGAGSINILSGGSLFMTGGSTTISAGTMTIASGGIYGPNFPQDLVTTIQNTGVFRPNGGQTLSGGTTLKALAGGKIIADNYYRIGYSTGDTAIGTLLVDGGTSSMSTLGSSDWGFGSLGNAKVTFSNSSVGTINNLTIGGNLGAASVSLLSSAQLTTTGTLLIGTGTGTSSSVAVTANGGTLVFGGPTTVRNGGRLTLTSGGMKFQNDATITTGSSLQWTAGNLEMSPNTTFTVAGGTFNISAGGSGLPSGATLKILNDGGANGGTGGKFSSGSFFDIGGSGATSGTLLVDGAGSTLSVGGTSDYGNQANAVATVTFSNSGVGTYNTLRMGANGGVAFLNIDGGALITNSSLITGNATVSPPPAAIIRLNSGVLNSMGTANFLHGTAIAMTGGTLTLGGNTTFSTGAYLHQTGGIFTMPANSTLSFEGGGTASILSNGIPSNSSVRVTSGGKLTVTNLLDVGSNGGIGTLLVDGGTSSFAVTATSSPLSSFWGLHAGATADVTFSNGATGDLSQTDTVLAATSGANARIKVLSGAKLTLHNLLTADSGGSATITVDAGTLNIVGSATFNNTLLNLQTAGASINFGGDTTFSTGSTFNWSGGNWDNAAGTTLSFDGGAGSFAFTGHILNNGSTLRITNAGTVSSSYYDVQSGTMTVQDPGSSFAASSDTYWGSSIGDSATITFSNFGVGSYNGSLTIGGDGGAALVNLSSSAKLNASKLTVGGGTHSDGVTFNVDGGTLNVIGLATFQNGATVNLQDGGMMLGGDATFSAGSTLNWSGGTLGTAAGTTLAFDGGVGSFSVFFGGAGLSNGSTLRIAAGTLITNGFLDIGNSIDGGATGTMFVDSGTFISTATGVGNFTDWGQNSGNAATITFQNSAVGSFNAGLNIGDGGGAATVNLLSSARLNTASLLMGNASGPSAGVNMTLNSASLTVTGNGTMNGGATLTLQSGSADFRSDLVMNSLSRINYNGGSLSVKGNLNLNSSARVFLSAGHDKTLRVGTAFVGSGLTMSNLSKLDLADNTLLIGYTGTSPLPRIRSYLLSGRAGGSWTGGQLTSSSAAAVFADPMNPHKTALGYLDNAFGFQQIEIKYTYLGDTNLDGQVDVTDLGNLATHWQQSAMWNGGDFNYDGTVDVTDLGALATNWQQGVSNPLGPDSLQHALEFVGLSPIVVPEPAMLMAISCLLTVAVRRRKDHRRF